MEIPKIASLFLLLSLEREKSTCCCWPELQKITKEVYVSGYEELERRTKLGLRYLNRSYQGQIECLFKDKDFYYIDHLVISWG